MQIDRIFKESEEKQKIAKLYELNSSPKITSGNEENFAFDGSYIYELSDLSKREIKSKLSVHLCDLT